MATIAQAPGDLNEFADGLESLAQPGSFCNESDRMAGGQFVRSRILDRTSAGVDVHGSAFAAYSPAYTKQKAKAGGRTDQVDLFGTGHHLHMLNAIAAQVTPGGFEVGLSGEEAERARALNEGTGRMPARRFFDVSEADLTDLQKQLGARVAARIGRPTSLLNLIASLKG